MLDEIKKQFSSAKILITLLIIAVGLYLLQIAWQVVGMFSDVIVMLISAWLVSIILEPVVDRLSRWTRMYKVVSALIIYLLFFGLIGYMVFLFIPEVGTQIQTLIKVLPGYLKPFPEFINKTGDLIGNYLTNSLTYIPSVANFFFSVFIVLIISFYFVVDKHKIGAEMLNLIPKKWHKDTAYIEDVVNTTFVSFLRVQLFFGILCGLVTAIILAIFGVPYIASTSFISGVLTMIPLLGPILGIIPPLLVAFVTDPTKALFIFIAYYCRSDYL